MHLSFRAHGVLQYGAFTPTRDHGPIAFKAARENGVAALAGPTMERWFTKGFRDQHPDKIASMIAMFGKTPLEGYIGCCEAVRDMDHREVVKGVKVPVLVIAAATIPRRRSPSLNSSTAYPGLQLAVVEGAHIANVENPQVYTETVLSHLRP